MQVRCCVGGATETRPFGRDRFDRIARDAEVITALQGAIVERVAERSPFTLVQSTCRAR